ncbi:MAG: 50S ribosomal protein L23 [Candidatus Nanohaloarchaea archaeon]
MKEERAWEVIEHPHMTEQAMDMVDRENKLVIMVDLDSDKKQVENAVETLFGVMVKKVNTQITPQAEKKAYVKLSPENDAMEVATKLGMM